MRVPSIALFVGSRITVSLIQECLKESYKWKLLKPFKSRAAFPKKKSLKQGVKRPVEVFQVRQA